MLESLPHGWLYLWEMPGILAPGAETPWIDIARQLARDDGVAALGPEAKKKVPGTDNLRRLIEAAGGRVLDSL